MFLLCGGEEQVENLRWWGDITTHTVYLMWGSRHDNHENLFAASDCQFQQCRSTMNLTDACPYVLQSKV